eukprot:6163365-Pleurochrysis_carterae.AAC.1
MPRSVATSLQLPRACLSPRPLRHVVSSSVAGGPRGCPCGQPPAAGRVAVVCVLLPFCVARV